MDILLFRLTKETHVFNALMIPVSYRRSRRERVRRCGRCTIVKDNIITTVTKHIQNFLLPGIEALWSPEHGRQFLDLTLKTVR